MNKSFPRNVIDDIDDLPGEVWKPIKGYAKKYYISNFGRTKSYYHNKAIVLKATINNSGYPIVALWKGGKR